MNYESSPSGDFSPPGVFSPTTCRVLISSSPPLTSPWAGKRRPSPRAARAPSRPRWFRPEQNWGSTTTSIPKCKECSWKTAGPPASSSWTAPKLPPDSWWSRTTPPPSFFLRLIGEDRITTHMKRMARSYQFDRGELFWGTVGVHELPNYKAAKGQPWGRKDCMPRTYFAPKDSAFMEDKYMHEIFLAACLPRCFILTAPDSIWDPTGGCTSSPRTSAFTCPARIFSRRNGSNLPSSSWTCFSETWWQYALT